MNKKQDLKLVFEFIADFLREEEPKQIINNEEKSINKILEESIKPQIENKLREKGSPERILEIMKRVDGKDRFSTNFLPKIQNNKLEHSKLLEEMCKEEERELLKLTENDEKMMKNTLDFIPDSKELIDNVMEEKKQTILVNEIQVDEPLINVVKKIIKPKVVKKLTKVKYKPSQEKKRINSLTKKKK